MKWTRDNRYMVRFKMTNRVQVKIYQHREVWESINGPIAKGLVIDHINGDGCDNRIENLRLVTPQLNNHNRRGANKNSQSGHRGVYWHKQKNRWHVQIMIGGKKRSLGLYEKIEDAINAYKKEAVYA